MADDKKPVSTDSVPEKDNRAPHVAAWHDAKNDDERRAAVKKHPKLADIYSEAGKFLAVVICILALGFGFQAQAQVQLFGNLSTITGTAASPFTTNSAVCDTNTARVSIGTIQLTTGGLTTIGSLAGYEQISLDGTNFINVGTYNPTNTSAGTVTIQQTTTNITIYIRLQAVVTNAVNIGANYTPYKP
jgi:hypothetical protein